MRGPLFCLYPACYAMTTAVPDALTMSIPLSLPSTS